MFCQHGLVCRNTTLYPEPATRDDYHNDRPIDRNRKREMLCYLFLCRLSSLDANALLPRGLPVAIVARGQEFVMSSRGLSVHTLSSSSSRQQRVSTCNAHYMHHADPHQPLHTIMQMHTHYHADTFGTFPGDLELSERSSGQLLRSPCGCLAVFFLESFRLARPKPERHPRIHVVHHLQHSKDSCPRGIRLHDSATETA